MNQAESVEVALVRAATVPKLLAVPGGIRTVVPRSLFI
jgi:hypothetical protein